MAKKAAPKAKTSSSGTPSTKVYEAFYSSTGLLPAPFCNQVQLLEQKMGMPVVLLWHGVADTNNMYAFLNDFNYYLFARKIGQLTRGEKVAVVIFSPGGDARAAYKLACLLRKHCGGFTAVVPQFAKSAATLFALGADRIVMGRLAEMGPLDVQIEDAEKEQRMSALEVVQAIERLNIEAMRAVDQQMGLWVVRSKKKVDTLLPVATNFVAEMMRPLFDKIDTVHYTGMARALKVAQDYAERLLSAVGTDATDAKTIAERLTTAYSDHGYVVDCDEMKRIGMQNVEEADSNIEGILETLAFMECNSTIIGPLKEKLI